MRLIAKSAKFLAVLSILTVSVWGIGCGGTTADDAGTDDAAQDVGDDPGSTTGGGVDAPTEDE